MRTTSSLSTNADCTLELEPNTSSVFTLHAGVQKTPPYLLIHSVPGLWPTVVPTCVPNQNFLPYSGAASWTSR